MSTSDNDILPGARLMQVQEWGYPLSVPRPTPDPRRAFSVIHITGNSRLPSAEGEASWRINDLSLQNSATFFVNRDGSIVQAMGDPLHMDPWSNGDANQPDLSNPRIAWWNAHRGYYNANELTLLSIENVGYEPGSPITQAQKRACAKIIAYFHKKAGVPINRTTVIGHYQLNSVTRPNCPAKDKSVIDEIVALATEEDPEVIAELRAKIAELEEANRRKWRRIQAQTARIESLNTEVASLETSIAELEAQIAQTPELRATVKRLRDRLASVKAKVAAMAADIADD